MQPPEMLTCIEVRRRLEGGATRPPLIVAEDIQGKTHELVMKFRHPDVDQGNFGPTSLACELLCSMIAREVGISVPDYYVVDVPPELELAVPSPELRRLFRKNVGLNFGCRYVTPSTEWSYRGVHATGDLLVLLESILSFDAAVLNTDRTGCRSNILDLGSDLMLIDHSYALGPVPGPCPLPANRIFDPNAIKEHCTFQALTETEELKLFHDLFDVWSSKLESTDWKRVRSYIPPEWERDIGDLDRILKFLSERHLHLGHLKETLNRVIR